MICQGNLKQEYLRQFIGVSTCPLSVFCIRSGHSLQLCFGLPQCFQSALTQFFPDDSELLRGSVL